MGLNNLSKKSPSNRGRNIIVLALTFVIGILVIAAIVQNRGLLVEAQPDRIGVTLQPTEHPAEPIATYNDSSPIVTAPAHVETNVTGPSKPNTVQPPTRDGLSTHGAASPIVTGQGAVVKATVDTRP